MEELESDHDHDEFLVVTHWESKSDFHRWTSSDVFKQSHSGPRLDSIAGHSEFEGFEVRLLSLPPEEQGLPIPNKAFSLL